MPPEAGAQAAVLAGLEAARRRVVMRQAGQAIMAAGLILAAIALVVPVTARALAGLIVAALILVGTTVRSRKGARTTKALAAALESRHARLQNLIVTAEELLRHPERSPAWIRTRVLSDAASALSDVDLSAVWPVRRLTASAIGAFALAGLAFLLAPLHLAGAGESVQPAVRETPDSPAVVIELTPPPYAHRSIVRLQNPERVEALEGTVARVSVANVRDARIRLGGRTLPLTAAGSGFSAIDTLTESGYFAIDTDDSTGATRLITVTVVPDRVPVVRVERPARDLLLPDSSASVEVTASVTDDIGIGALAMRYTKVSGAGEQIDFVEGELPLQIDRQNDQHWRARGAIALPSLKLEPGDSLVYRLVARDGRPGRAGSAASDTYFIEIAGPGQVPLEGVEMPPDQERYALSQQMIVVKIKRLREREKSLAPEALGEETGAIAAEQRSVRANFVFLMGGEVEDEDVEAEQSNEIQEGRLENTSRRELSRAVTHMTAAEQGLTSRDTASALRAATLAVEALQRAFGRSRYLLRSLASRTRLDPSRRLTGVRDDVERGERALPPAAADPEAQRARALLAQFLALMTKAPAGSSKQNLAALSELGEAVVAVRPAERSWQDASKAVMHVRDLAASGADAAQMRDGTREVVRHLTALGRRSAPTVAPADDDLQRIESARAPGGRGR